MTAPPAWRFVAGDEEEAEAPLPNYWPSPDHRRPSADDHDDRSGRRPARRLRGAAVGQRLHDVRDIGAVVDDGYLLEPHANWAANLVTAFATSVDGPSASSPTAPDRRRNLDIRKPERRPVRRPL